MLPPAPPTFSITIGWPSTGRMRSAMMRAAASVDPPGGNGTTSVSERTGKLCACALAKPARAVSASAARNLVIICSPPSVDFSRTRQRFLQLLQRERLAARDVEDRGLAAAAQFGGVRQLRRYIDRYDDGAVAVGVNEVAGFHR